MAAALRVLGNTQELRAPFMVLHMLLVNGAMEVGQAVQGAHEHASDHEVLLRHICTSHAVKWTDFRRDDPKVRESS